MAKRSIARKGKKRNRKKWVVSSQAPLCALGKVLCAKSLFQPLHTGVNIRQKTVVYRPTDKLVFIVLGMLSGAETVSEINTKVRPDRALLEAFGYHRCADASVIQQTLDAATPETVASLEAALAAVRFKQGQSRQVSLGSQEMLHADIARFRFADWQACRGFKEGVCPEDAEHLYPAGSHGGSVGIRKRYFLISYIPGDTRSDAVFKPIAEQT